MMNRKDKNFKIAFGGVITALSIVIMFLTGIIPTMTYALPAVSGALLMAVVIEIGPKFAGIVYAAVAFLSFIVVADKEAAVMYAMFFGYYPIIKSFIEKKLNKALSWLVKYIIFNVSVIFSYFIVTKLLCITYDDMGAFGNFFLPVLLLLANFVFAIYDIALTRLVSAYLMCWRKKVKRMFK